MDGVAPKYKITANDKNITAMVKDRLLSLRLTDAVGLESDILEITITDENIDMPPTGAEIGFSMGYDNQLKDMGLFVVDEIERSGWPQKMVIRARACIQDKTPKGKKSLRSQQNREWKAETTLQSIVQKIAGDHGLNPAISGELSGVKIPHTLQTDESDLNFLMRIAKKYDAVVKPVAGKLILAKLGTGKSVGGQTINPITIQAKGCKSYSMTQAKREDAGTTVAYYHKKKEAKRHSVQVGDGSEPIRRIKTNFGTKDEATAAARAEFDRRKRGKTTVSLSVVGNPDISAEAPLTLTGFVKGVDGRWLITRVEHSIDSNGFATSIEAEEPNTAGTPDAQDVEQ
jgi:phage protein D